MSTINHLQGHAFAKKKGDTIYVFEGPHTLADFMPVIAEGSDVPRMLKDRFADVVNVKDFGAKGDGMSDDTAAIQAALDTGKNIFIPMGIYLCNRELELKTKGQVVAGAGAGEGYRGGNYNTVIDYFDVATLLFTEPVDGSAAKRVRTRVRYRSSASDPQDDPLSVCLNVQAEGVVLSDFAVRLKTDVSKEDRAQILSIDPATATELQRQFLVLQNANLGANWDVGIFIGSRLRVTLNHVNVIGYFRETNVWLDSTNGHNMPRFPDLNGTPYPSDNVNGGADGFTSKECMFFGGLWGMRVQGPEPKAGSDTYETTYYDELSGGLVRDRRGSFGCSDLCLEGCQIYGPQHYSHLRRVDMTSQGDPVADISKGGAFSIGGLAGNGTNRIHGHRYINCRFASNAPFGVRVDRSSRDLFLGCTIDNEGQAYDTSGNPITISAETSFNGIVLTKNAQRCRYIGTGGNFFSTYTNFYGGRHTILACDSDGELNNHLSAKDLTIGGFDSGSENNCSVRIVADPGQAAAVFFGDSNTPSQAAFNWYSTSKNLTFAVGSEELIRIYTSISQTDKRFYVGGLSGIGFSFRGDFSSIYANNEESLRFLSGQIRSMGALRPGTDNALTLGTGAARWSEVFAGTGSINTSDSRCKSSVASASDTLLDAIGAVPIHTFQFMDAVEKKGSDAARFHAGVIAQEVASAFQEHGLDAARYGLFCHDEWQDEYETVEVVDQPEVLDENGEVVSPAVTHTEQRLITAAGDRYGIRYEELLMLECARLRRELQRMKIALTDNGIKVGDAI